MKHFRLSLNFVLAFLATIALCLTVVPSAWAFCGFYVAKADSKLYNQASQVAIAREGNQTVLTMANDYQGEVKDFAIVVPVPVVLKKEQVKVANPAVIERLDAFSSPRLVEYFDPDPCQRFELEDRIPMSAVPAPQAAGESKARRNDAFGVTIEAKFSVGEYDILILSAKESGGLETWLRQNDYKIPDGARKLLRPYIRQKMKFFVAKVNLEKFEDSGFTRLRPLQMTYQSPRFMLPIRLGMVNAQQAQDLIVYVLSPQGRAEVTNYRTVQVPSNVNIPEFVKNEFGPFYKDLFSTAYDRENRNVAFLEYAWNMANCDPCSADPLSPEELKEAGVFWLDRSSDEPNPGIWNRRRPPVMNNGVYVTRLHVRYTRDKFPEDLMFQTTNNQDTFQGRYVMQHPFLGEAKCAEGKRYRAALPRRFEQEAQTLSKLTGWNINDIRKKLPTIKLADFSWFDRIWFNFLG